MSYHDQTEANRCGAHARSTGEPCEAKAMRNGRCRLHGGLSTGPKTERGRRAVSESVKRRWQVWRELNGRIACACARHGVSEVS
jgi:hypothetical protein